MESPIIDFPLELHTFPSENGTVKLADDDDLTEMITLRNLSYTSLKDLLPPSPSSTASPTSGSWKEIPIKDPLVQHAAWAYLQPMPGEVRDDDRWWRCFQKTGCRLLSCINDVVSVLLKSWVAAAHSGPVR